MGNTPSSAIKPVTFGTIHGTNGYVRPGYYFSGKGLAFKILYKGVEIPINLNEHNFQKLKYGYLKSNQRVFYNGKHIEQANPSTFSVTTRGNVGSLSKYPEKNEQLKKLNSVLGMDFVGNRKRIYHKNKIIYEET